MSFQSHFERPLDPLNQARTSLGPDSTPDARLLAGKLAHEMNNPLDSVLRYVNLTIQLLDGQAFEKPRDYLLRSRQGLLHMSNLVNDWLVNAGQAQAGPKRLPLTEILDLAIDMSLSQQDQQTIQIKKVVPKTLPKLDPRALLQISVNLMTNAVDALSMQEKRTLEISVRRRQNMLLIEFCDNGVGLPQTDTEEIFTPFYSTKPNGKGLGLTICKEIIEKHHGRMDAKNRPGGGAVFTVHLPLENLI